MKLRPLGCNVVVRPEDKTEKQTMSGILIPKTSEELDSTMIGEVVAVGEGEWDNGRMKTPRVKVGDMVLYNKYSGDDVILDDEQGKKVTYKILYGESLTCAIE